MTDRSLHIKNKIAGSRDRLYRVSLAWCGDQMLAEDLVHETIATGIDKCHQLRDEKQLFSWLYSILNNKWYRYLQKRKNHDDLNEHIPCQDSGPLSNCQALDLIQQVRYAISKLPAIERQVISLVDLEEFSYCEVAKTLDIPIGTVMSRLHRARKNLLDIIDRQKTENNQNNIQASQVNTKKRLLHRVK